MNHGVPPKNPADPCGSPPILPFGGYSHRGRLDRCGLPLQEWIDAGTKGTFVTDCRITSSVRAPWLTEWMAASLPAKAAVCHSGPVVLSRDS